MTRVLLDRRSFLEAGGLSLAGLWALPPLGLPPEEVVILLRSDTTGARAWFEPRGVAVPPGTRIRWVLESGVHTTTAYHPRNGNAPCRIPEGATPWDSGHLLEAGESFTVTLTVPGVYDYFCAPHEAAGMVGRIVVGQPGAPPHFPAMRAEWRALPPAAARAFPEVADVLRHRSVG